MRVWGVSHECSVRNWADFLRLVDNTRGFGWKESIKMSVEGSEKQELTT